MSHDRTRRPSLNRVHGPRRTRAPHQQGPGSDRFQHQSAHQREQICHHARCREAEREIREALSRSA